MKIFSLLSRYLYQLVAKPIFFRKDPEKVHDYITWLGQQIGNSRLGRGLVRAAFRYEHPALNQNIWGIYFSNPVGLSAGFDKDAHLYQLMESVGFGFSEIGTVTFGPYEGNQKPRLYRLPKSKALVVYYGLKNIGAESIIMSLKTKTKTIPQVISIGRTNSRETSRREAGINDYYNSLKIFADKNVGDIYEINISCPNTFGGEPFTNAADLMLLLQTISVLKITKPIFLKMPINLPWEEFRNLLDVAIRFDIHAVVIGNLNKNKNDKTIKDIIPSHMNGGISGKPTWELSNYLITKTYQYCGNKIKIIGVGGIFSAEDAYEKIKCGASMIELITGMIYEGPQLIGEINRELVQLLKNDGYHNIQEAIGTYHRNNRENGV